MVAARHVLFEHRDSALEPPPKSSPSEPKLFFPTKFYPRSKSLSKALSHNWLAIASDRALHAKFPHSPLVSFTPQP